MHWRYCSLALSHRYMYTVHPKYYAHGSRFVVLLLSVGTDHDDVIKWKHFPRYWPFVRGIHAPDGFPSQRPVTRSFGVFFDLCLNKWLSKQLRRRLFEKPLRSLWRHCNILPTSLRVTSLALAILETNTKTNTLMSASTMCHIISHISTCRFFSLDIFTNY